VRCSEASPHLLLEPGTGEALEIPFSFARFHEQLDELREPALAASFFASWARANPEVLPLGAMQCAGYKVPLFLGGKDSVDNLEIVDVEVYWSLSGQLCERTRVLPPGTSVTQVKRALVGCPTEGSVVAQTEQQAIAHAKWRPSAARGSSAHAIARVNRIRKYRDSRGGGTRGPSTWNRSTKSSIPGWTNGERRAS
jgi:hypothetical protein